MERVIINGRKWSKSNLKVSSFRNGEPLLYAHTLNEWNVACENELPAYCISETESEVDGYLYNVFAVKDPRGLFDNTKWMLPRQKDWEELIEFCGGLDISGYYLKSKSGWSSGYDFNSKITCRECKEWNDEYRSKVPCHNCLDKRFEIINHNGNGIDTFGFDAKPTGQRVGGGSVYKNLTYFDRYSSSWWCDPKGELGLFAALKKIFFYERQLILRLRDNKVSACFEDFDRFDGHAIRLFSPYPD